MGNESSRKRTARRYKTECNRGSISIDIVTMAVGTLLVLAFFVHLIPVFHTLVSLNYYANELIRTASVTGRVGVDANERATELKEATGLEPRILWDCECIDASDRVQLDGDIRLTLELEQDIGLFGGFASFPVTLRSNADARSEVYWR